MINIPSIKLYTDAFEISQIILNMYQLNVFPININNFIKKLQSKYRIIAISSREYENYCKINPSIKSNNFFKIKDGRTIYYPKEDIYVIIYNPYKSRYRIRFTLMHELAHILLEHLEDTCTEIGRGGIADSSYYKMEGEANTFAGNFLAPPILINDAYPAGDPDTYDICRMFGISKQAVNEYRYRDYLYWKTIPHHQDELDILARYHDTINNKYCSQCNTRLPLNINYCYICGNNEFQAYEEGYKEMIYSGIELGKDGKIKECPICKNEEILDGDFCHICGTNIKNRCNNYLVDILNNYDHIDYDEHCKGELPLNARHCPYCGGETTFLLNKLLEPWNKDSEGAKLLDEDFEQEKPPKEDFSQTNLCNEDFEQDIDLPF